MAFRANSFKFLWKKENSKPPTMPFRIVACTFPDNLSRNSCIEITAFVDAALTQGGFICIRVWLSHLLAGIFVLFLSLKTIKRSSGQMQQFCAHVANESTLILLSLGYHSSLRKHPFLLALRNWGRFARRNVCDSAAEIPYWWRKSMFT